MAKHKDTGEPRQPRRPNRTNVPLHIYIPPLLRAALDGLAQENRRLLTTEVIIALENHLKAAGRWPPAEPPPE